MANSPSLTIVFMLEEESAEHVLQNLQSKILPTCVECIYIRHQGREDLQKSIPIKLKSWANSNTLTLFVILHDQDNHDCRLLKQELQKLCVQGGHRYSPLIRIVCRELEAWYFGDLNAVKKAYPKFPLARYQRKQQFRNPDVIPKPSEILRSALRTSKGQMAKNISRHMQVHSNTSESFNQFLAGVQNLVKVSAQCNPDQPNR